MWWLENMREAAACSLKGEGKAWYQRVDVTAVEWEVLRRLQYTRSLLQNC